MPSGRWKATPPYHRARRGSRPEHAGVKLSLFIAEHLVERATGPGRFGAAVGERTGEFADVVVDVRQHLLAVRVADRFIFIIDGAEGDKIPRKGGPGICNSDLLVINKTDLAPHVGADLEVMRRDATKMRGERPFLMISLRQKEGVAEVVNWVREQLASHAAKS